MSEFDPAFFILKYNSFVISETVNIVEFYLTINKLSIGFLRVKTFSLVSSVTIILVFSISKDKSLWWLFKEIIKSLSIGKILKIIELEFKKYLNNYSRWYYYIL